MTPTGGGRGLSALSGFSSLSLPSHASSSATLQRLLASCRSESQAAAAVTALLPHVARLVAARREGVVWHMVAACAGGDALRNAEEAAAGPAGGKGAAADEDDGGAGGRRGGGGSGGTRLPVVPFFTGHARPLPVETQRLFVAALAQVRGPAGERPCIPASSYALSLVRRPPPQRLRPPPPPSPLESKLLPAETLPPARQPPQRRPPPQPPRGCLTSLPSRRCAPARTTPTSSVGGWTSTVTGAAAQRRSQRSRRRLRLLRRRGRARWAQRVPVPPLLASASLRCRRPALASWRRCCVCSRHPRLVRGRGRAHDPAPASTPCLPPQLLRRRQRRPPPPPLRWSSPPC